MKTSLLLALLTASAISAHAQLYNLTFSGTIPHADAFTQEHGYDITETVVLNFQPVAILHSNGTFGWVYIGDATLMDEHHVVLAQTNQLSGRLISHTLINQYSSFTFSNKFSRIGLGSSDDSVITEKGVPLSESANKYDLMNSGSFSLFPHLVEEVVFTRVEMSILGDPGIPQDPSSPQGPGTPQGPAANAVPEPSTYGLLGGGVLLALGALRRKQRPVALARFAT